MQAPHDSTVATQDQPPVPSGTSVPPSGFSRRHRETGGYGELLDKLVDDLDDH